MILSLDRPSRVAQPPARRQEPSGLLLDRARRRGADFLSSCQQASGAITEVVDDPMAVLRHGGSAADRFFLGGGADIWNTVNAILSLRELGRRHRGAERFVLRSLLADGSLSHSSRSRGPCAETTAAAILALPGDHPRIRRALLRLALPDGRFPTFIVDARGGYDIYLTGPSTTAWALTALGSKKGDRNALAGAYRQLERRGLSALLEDLGDRAIWQGHSAFYATPFYPAHLAAPLVGRRQILDDVVRRQNSDGGWGFGTRRSPSSALPTALAMLTLAASSRDDRVRSATGKGARWLVGQQAGDGSFPLQPAPQSLWYTGKVYVTAVVLRALGRAAA